MGIEAYGASEREAGAKNLFFMVKMGINRFSLKRGII